MISSVNLKYRLSNDLSETRNELMIRKIIIGVLLSIILPISSHAYYQAEQGRWISRDPIEEISERNLYCFINNNPLNSYDIAGLLRNCGQEQIDAFNSCWNSCPPWPFKKDAGYYKYCQLQALNAYLACEAANAAEKALEAAKKAAEYCKNHPIICALSVGGRIIDSRTYANPCRGLLT